MTSNLAQTLRAARRIAGVGLPGVGPIPVPEAIADAVVGHLVNQRLTGVAVEGVRSGALVLPDRAGAALSEAHLRASVVVVALQRLLSALQEDLRDEDLEVVVLKGPALAHPFYGSITRTYGDIDLLVPVAGWQGALDLLARRGFRRMIPEPRPGFDRRFGKGASHVDDEGYEVDLHRTLALGAFGLWIDLDELLGRTVPLELDGRSYRRLDDTATLLHVCLHASLGRSPPQLMPLRDVLQVAHTGDVDWDGFVALARSWRIVAPVSWALRTAVDTLGVGLPAAATDLDLGSPGRAERWALRAQVTDRRGSGGIEVATLLALPGIRDRIGYVRALLFPSEGFRRVRGGEGERARSRRPAAWVRDALRRARASRR
jgi:hypothetical protein